MLTWNKNPSLDKSDSASGPNWHQHGTRLCYSEAAHMLASRAPPGVMVGMCLGHECPRAPGWWGLGFAPAHIFPWVEGANQSPWAFRTSSG